MSPVPSGSSTLWEVVSGPSIYYTAASATNLFSLPHTLMVVAFVFLLLVDFLAKLLERLGEWLALLTAQVGLLWSP